jgi:hypothetical protein
MNITGTGLSERQLRGAVGNAWPVNVAARILLNLNDVMQFVPNAVLTDPFADMAVDKEEEDDEE